MIPQSVKQRSLVIPMAINNAHHAFEMLDPVNGRSNAHHPLRLKSISGPLASESRAITGQDLALFELGLDRVPELLHLVSGGPES